MTFGWKRAETIGGFVNAGFVLSMAVFVVLQAVPDFIYEDPDSQFNAMRAGEEEGRRKGRRRRNHACFANTLLSPFEPSLAGSEQKFPMTRP
tara:strand:+ start:1653 stop:1928 length:276 start_codon:yes stop_codon:yes gene_type:complete